MYKFFVVCLFAGLIGACTTTDQRISGAAAGAGTGALIGGPIGAVAGGAIGAVSAPTVVRTVNRY
jgi:osmotically inducible lipoprotein OsmB